jgi:hypothetical protein
MKMSGMPLNLDFKRQWSKIKYYWHKIERNKKVLSGTWDSDMHLVLFSFLKVRQLLSLLLKGLYELVITKKNYLLFRVILNLFLIRPHILKTGHTVKTWGGFSVYKGLNVFTQTNTNIVLWFLSCILYNIPNYYSYVTQSNLYKF